MSLLEEMKIQGIRGFGPENPQKIKFSTPVTLILGQNGTGKTTIIECLKYAVTGELPPGSKSGASFIHDPKLARSVEVKAQVELKARDVRNCSFIASRSLVATQRGTAKQPSLKTLDATIKRLTPNGEEVSLSSRCSDLDKEMATNLGASKAVFESVIFCHQEESNWPLQEAKAVKERFDDLFASSRYVKALDAIRKTRLDQEENAKVCRVELKHLSRSKEEANQARDEKTEKQLALGNEMQKLADVGKNLDPIATELTLYRKKYAELVEYQSRSRSCTTEIGRLEVVVKDLARRITQEFEGSDEELRAAMEQADEQLAGRQQSCLLTETQLQQDRSAIEANEKNRSKLIVKQTRIAMEVKRLDEAVNCRNQILGRLASEFGLDEISQKCESGKNVSSDEVDAVRRQLKDTLQKAETELAQTRMRVEADAKTAQMRIDEARTDLVRMEQSISGLQSALADNKRESSIVEFNLQKANAASGELGVIGSKLREATEARRLLEASNGEADLRNFITKSQDEHTACEAEMAALEIQISEAQNDLMANHERNALERNKTKTIESARKLRSRHLDVLEQIFSGNPVPGLALGGDPTSNTLTHQFNKRLEDLVLSCKTTNQNLSKLQHQCSKLETEMSFLRKQLYEKQDTLREQEERILSACGSVDLERNLDKLALRKTQLEGECATEEGSLFLWKKFRDRLTVEQDCPLCHRSFESERSHKELTEELEKRISTMPTELDAKRRELHQIVVQYEKLLELRPIYQDFTELKEKKLPALKHEVEMTQSRLTDLHNKIDLETSRLEVIQADESLARSLQGDMAILEKYEKEIVNLNCSLTALTPTTTNEKKESKSISMLQTERESLRSKRTILLVKIEDLRKKLDCEISSRQEAVNAENALLETHLKLEKEFQSLTNLKLELDRLTGVRRRLVADLEHLSEQLPACRTALSNTEEVRLSVSQTGEAEVAIAEANCQKFREQCRRVTEACRSAALVNVDVNDGGPPLGHPRDQLEFATAELVALDATTEELKAAVLRNSRDIEDLRNAISNHKIFQRELEDNVQLRKTHKQLSLLHEQFREIQQNIDSCQSGISGSTDLVAHVKNLSDKEDSLRKQKQIVNDRITQLQTELRMLESSLVGKYADADKEYMRKVYELKTAEVAAIDLQHYHEALDRAIMAYHSEKMNEINEIIRDLWRTTYRGNDIDHIKICSEQEPLSVSTNASRSRRTYNYRVVMVKAAGSGTPGTDLPAPRGAKLARLTAAAETQLDMRGRCSAGQKVLASLVIRMALAEVFCLQCGVLALDEPTTNLDRENIESLAYALTEIIKTRSMQRNFQLIVITHDEDFIELLGRAECTGHLFRLSRNLEGHSEIEKIRIEDQFQ